MATGNKNLRKALFRTLVFFIWLMAAWFVFMSQYGPTGFYLLSNPANLLYFNSAYVVDPEIRQYGLNITENCGGDQECVVFKIYNDLADKTFYSYTPYGRLQKPRVVLEEKTGDCKSLGGLFVNLMVNLGVKAYLTPDLELNHVLAVAEPRNSEWKYVIDLTEPVIIRMAKDSDPWGFFPGRGPCLNCTFVYKVFNRKQ